MHQPARCAEGFLNYSQLHTLGELSSKCVKGEVVVFYVEPLATQNLKCLRVGLQLQAYDKLMNEHRLSLRIHQEYAIKEGS